MKKCMGCGTELQNTGESTRGYAKNLEQDYCQSCFRLRHYRDFKRVKAKVDDGKTLEFIEGFEGHILWILDIMHLNQSLHPGLLRTLRNKEVTLVINKRDLLSKSVSDGKLKQSIMIALKGMPLNISEILFVSALKKGSLEPLHKYLNDAPCAFVGAVNAGKSSVLNQLLKGDTLSVSPVASTTADVIRIDSDDYEVYDTPGLSTETKLSDKLSDKALVMLSPQKTIKPMVFQIYEKQTLILGNLGAITIDPVKSINVVSYLPFAIKRIKPERMDTNLALEHEFMIEEPKYKNRTWPHDLKNMDLEIFDIGFISIQGECKSIETKMDESAELIYRKAII